MQRFRVGTRGSRLALAQTNEMLNKMSGRKLRVLQNPLTVIASEAKQSAKRREVAEGNRGDLVRLLRALPSQRPFGSDCFVARLASRAKRASLLAMTGGYFCDGLKFEIVPFDTTGDRDKATPIDKVEGTDFFTDAIEQALLAREIDFAVHSAKDLPDVIPDGLAILTITESYDPNDALVSKRDLKLNELPRGAQIGTSSFRRKSQLKRFRPDFVISDLRGNIEERLKILDEGPLDAIVIAACALRRLGLEARITERIPLEIIQPHPLQGALAIEAREGNGRVRRFIQEALPEDNERVVKWIRGKSILLGQGQESLSSLQLKG